jgi:hypothetical protein
MQFPPQPHVPSGERPLVAASRGQDAEEPAMPPVAPLGQAAARLSAAERALAEAHARIRAGEVDLDLLDLTIAIARDCLAEARALNTQTRRELAIVRWERTKAQRERTERDRDASTGHSEAPITPVVADAPDAGLCPDPRAAASPAELMDTMRRYWIWAGRPSYRAMARHSGRRYAASTIHAALHADTLPRLDMIQAIILGCRGSTTHQQAFASAWRRLQLPPPSTRPIPAAPPILRPLSA